MVAQFDQMNWQRQDYLAEYVPDILHATVEFYGIQTVDALPKCVDQFNRGHEKWVQDFDRYKEAYSRKLAQMVFDYTAMAVAGELRHAKGQSRAWHPDIPVGGSREEAFDAVVQKYTPHSILKAAIPIMKEHSWTGGYGGKLWGTIAEAGLRWEELGDIGFIDHCVDLSHNSGTYFDKVQAGVFGMNSKTRYKEFLDFKQRCTPSEFFIARRVSARLVRLFERAKILGILEDTWYVPKESEQMTNEAAKVLGYEPLEWGSQELPYTLKEKPTVKQVPLSKGEEWVDGCDCDACMSAKKDAGYYDGDDDDGEDEGEEAPQIKATKTGEGKQNVKYSTSWITAYQSLEHRGSEQLTSAVG